MPKGYIIVTEKITDPERFAAYGRKAVPTILQYGGKPLVVHDDPEVIEGQWHGSRTIVLEFESVEAAHAWYRSPEYQSVIGDRHASAESNVAVVAGFEMPG